MASRGASETKLLKEKIENQLNRLLLQLEDIEELKEDLDDEEYEITKKETLEQMEEFEATLRKMMKGDISLVDEFGSIQLAIQAAIRDAFRTPEVIKLFARKEPEALRQRLSSLKRDLKLGRLPEDAFVQQAVEILLALKKLGEKLSAAEADFLQRNMTASLDDFEEVGESEDVADEGIILSRAGNDIDRAQS
eukprot:TRINITY_DN911_c0_g4_i1.p1 TRINITY_DN911_c0_g4~~TRINITY_DN911_c0_g4_i1.p1  ORF type:complete len:193 (+),score=74.96 TRINITY_DN911_c0_g4_i1:117-695(+)